MRDCLPIFLSFALIGAAALPAAARAPAPASRPVADLIITNARAEFQEKDKGSITPGKLADLVILSEDIFAIDPKTIKNVRVTATLVGGRVVFQEEGARAQAPGR